MFDSLIEHITAFVADIPTLWQWAGVMVAGMIPFIESYAGTAIGVIVGVHPALAAGAAIVGNITTMLLFVLTAGTARDKVVGTNNTRPLSARRQKVKRMFDRYGVAVVSLAGQAMLPSQITSAAMVSFGASRKAVIAWQLVSIVLWGVAFGLIATGVSSIVA